MKWIKLWVPDEGFNMTLEQDGFWSRLLRLAGRCAEIMTPGTIGVADGCGYTLGQLCKLMEVSEKVFVDHIAFLLEEKMIVFETYERPIVIANWKHYQGEYLRKRDWRAKSRGIVPSNVPSQKPEPDTEEELEPIKKKTGWTPQTQKLLDVFKGLFKNTFKEEYVKAAKDFPLLRGLQETHTAEAIIFKMGLFFKRREAFLDRAGYTIGVFYSQFNSLNQREKAPAVKDPRKMSAGERAWEANKRHRAMTEQEGDEVETGNIRQIHH